MLYRAVANSPLVALNSVWPEYNTNRTPNHDGHMDLGCFCIWPRCIPKLEHSFRNSVAGTSSGATDLTAGVACPHRWGKGQKLNCRGWCCARRQVVCPRVTSHLTFAFKEFSQNVQLGPHRSWMHPARVWTWSLTASLSPPEHFMCDQRTKSYQRRHP